MSDIQSKPYQPDPQQCCEACVFGPWTGVHHADCVKFEMHPCSNCGEPMPVLRRALGYYYDCGITCNRCSERFRFFERVIEACDRVIEACDDEYREAA